MRDSMRRSCVTISHGEIERGKVFGRCSGQSVALMSVAWFAVLLVLCAGLRTVGTLAVCGGGGAFVGCTRTPLVSMYSASGESDVAAKLRFELSIPSGNGDDEVGMIAAGILGVDHTHYSDHAALLDACHAVLFGSESAVPSPPAARPARWEAAANALASEMELAIASPGTSPQSLKLALRTATGLVNDEDLLLRARERFGELIREQRRLLSERRKAATEAARLATEAFAAKAAAAEMAAAEAAAAEAAAAEAAAAKAAAEAEAEAVETERAAAEEERAAASRERQATNSLKRERKATADEIFLERRREVEAKKAAEALEAKTMLQRQAMLRREAQAEASAAEAVARQPGGLVSDVVAESAAESAAASAAANAAEAEAEAEVARQVNNRRQHHSALCATCPVLTPPPLVTRGR